MPKHELKQLQGLIRQELQRNQCYSPQDLIDKLAKNDHFYESDVKYALLGLVRRNEVELTNGNIQLSSAHLVTV